MKAGPNREATTSFFSTVAARQNEWGSHGVPRASSIGDDLRKQYFGLRNARIPVPLVSAPIGGEALWGMAAGNRQEDPVYDVLREQGYSVTGIQAGAIRYQDADKNVQVKLVPDNERMAAVITALKRTGSRPFLTMHIDGIIEGGPDKIPPTLLELKLATMFSFGGMVQHGVMSDKPGYRIQATICAGSFELPYARFMVFSRDKSATEWFFHKMRSANPINENAALYVEDMQIDPRHLQMADFRALYLLDCVEKGEMPDPDMGISPLHVRVEKDGSMSHLFPCGWCEWKEPCLRSLQQSGVNINEYIVTADLRTKKEKDNAAK